MAYEIPDRFSGSPDNTIPVWYARLDIKFTADWDQNSGDTLVLLIMLTKAAAQRLRPG